MYKEIITEERVEKIEELVALFRNVVYESHEKKLLSSKFLNNISKESQEVSLVFERFLAKKSQRLDRLHFKKIADELTIEALSGACPCINHAKTVKYLPTPDWEADIISMLGGSTNPTLEIKIGAYQARKDMSIFQAFSRLSPDYVNAALNKAQIRHFCLKYRYFLQDEKSSLVFLLKNFYSSENGSSRLMGVITQADSRGLHVFIVPEHTTISVSDDKNYVFIVPLSL